MKYEAKAALFEHFSGLFWENYVLFSVTFVGKTEHFSAETKASRKEGELFLPLRQELKHSSLLDVRFTIYLILTHKSGKNSYFLTPESSVLEKRETSIVKARA